MLYLLSCLFTVSFSIKRFNGTLRKEERWFPYPDDINAKIESAHEKSMGNVSWEDSDGDVFNIDFATMTEHIVGDTSHEVKVSRKAKGGMQHMENISIYLNCVY